MPDIGQDNPGLGELSRQVRDVLVRFEALAARLESQFVRSDLYGLYQKNVEQDLKDLSAICTKATTDLDSKLTREMSHLSERVRSLEDNQKWLVRLIVSFVVLGVLAAAIGFQKANGGV